MLRRRSLGAALAANVRTTTAEDAWVESIDADTDKPFYYHEETRISQWEIPAGVKLKRADGTEEFTEASAGGRRGRRASESIPASRGMLLMLLVFSPFLLVFGGLVILYLRADADGLDGALKSIKKKRDRSLARATKQEKTGKARGKFKLSQDGKGGRSANS